MHFNRGAGHSRDSMSHVAIGALSLAMAAASLLGVAENALGQTIRYEPTHGVATFAVREPVLRLKPGATVETRTFSKPGDYYDPKTAGPWPGEVGPFFLEGAAPGDTLVVRVVRLRPNRDIAISNVTPAD